MKERQSKYCLLMLHLRAEFTNRTMVAIVFFLWHFPSALTHQGVYTKFTNFFLSEVFFHSSSHHLPKELSSLLLTFLYTQKRNE